MKKYFYIVIPVAAFLLILANMLFGHELFASPTEQVANKYSIYVHLQPEWNSDNKNILFEVTNSWHKTKQENKNLSFNAKDLQYNANHLQYLSNKPYVELKHSFSNCQEEWQPMLYRKAVDTLRHEIEYMQGSQLSTDPDISIYPDVDNLIYDVNVQQQKLKTGYAQFIPICSMKDVTSYDYSIKTDNQQIGFDVYFVKSEHESFDFFNNQQSFDYYAEEECYGQNKQSYSGTCNNVSKNGGLLIIVPDELHPWITKFTINLYEK